MQALKYTSREVNRNFRIKVSGLGIHELKGFTGFVGLVGSELANNLLDRAFRSKAVSYTHLTLPTTERV